MTRRKFLCGLPLGLGAAPLAEAQEAGKVYRIGTIGPIEPRGEVFLTFRERLQELGYSESRNVIFEQRGAEGRLERLQELAQDLIAHNVDIIVAWGTPAVAAAKRITTRIPIVMASSGDAAATGLVESLSRPGGTSVDTSNPAKRGRRKAGHRGGRPSGWVVGRSPPRGQVGVSGGTTKTPPAEIGGL